MTAKQFDDAFRDLIHRALSETPCPLSQMVLAMEIEKTRCVNIMIEIETRKREKELAGKIIPANGRIN